MKSILSLIALLLAFSFGRPQAHAQIVSAFATDDEGWKIAHMATALNGPSSSPNRTSNSVFSATNGNPGGHIQWGVDVGALWSFYQAPQTFLGNLTNYYGGSLSFDVTRHGGNLGGTDYPGVILVGGGITLVCCTSIPPVDVWTHYSVPLSSSDAWHKTNMLGAVPSAVDFLGLLANLQAIRIRGERAGGGTPETGGLDNVMLCPPEALTITPVRSNIVLSWSASGCPRTLEARDVLTESGIWSAEGTPPIVSDGRFWVTNSAPGVSRFYRLR